MERRETAVASEWAQVVPSSLHSGQPGSASEYLDGARRSGHVRDHPGDAGHELLDPRHFAVFRFVARQGPTPGDTAFTVPLFDDFMTRIMPLR